MNSKKNSKNRIVPLLTCGAFVIALATPVVNFAQDMPEGTPMAPKVIQIAAKKYEFSPSEVTLKRGEPVVLRLTSEDRSHGFLLKPLKIDADIAPGKATEVAVTPDAVGQYTVICDHYCGTGHGGMKMKLTVIE